MTQAQLAQIIAEEIARYLNSKSSSSLLENAAPEEQAETAAADITSAECKSRPLLDHPQDLDALIRMKRKTVARIGVGRAGPRLNTQTMLTLRADHANARDAVFADVNKSTIDSMGLFTVQSMCQDKATFVTRPDLGRVLSPDAVKLLKENCITAPDVQVYASDGLSSTAIEANLDKILPVILESLTDMGLRVGTPFFMRFGRVAAEDQVAEVLGAKVVCVLIGERPGLATAESMSAYIAYNAYVGMPESKRTVISNIHRNGLSAVEAGAYIAEAIGKIFQQKASGVDLVK